ncbi:MAG: carboxypeptidase-like regulatory domain-containing protein, partial [Candidatus Poseidoniia archaeon]
MGNCYSQSRQKNGAGREGAEVVVTYDDGLERAARRLCDEDLPSARRISAKSNYLGECLFTSVVPGIPLIVDVIDPIHRRTRRHVNPLRGGEERYQEIVLRPGGALRMRAVDELETPLPGARVVAYHQVGDSWLAAASAMTDTKGEATLRGLKAGVHAVTCVGWNLSGTDLYVIQD